MRFHELKCWPEYYQPLEEGKKRFDARKNDRSFQVGDILVEREWNPTTKEYTGRQSTFMVDYMVGTTADKYDANLFTNLGLNQGYVIMSIHKVKIEVTEK